MAELFEKGLEYRTIGTHRSAISAFHDPIENIRVGNHPRVSALMSGIFNKRPPQPKYPFIWDVETVLDFLRKLPGNDLLSDKLLTLKVSMLLSLLSASRVSEIINLRVDYLTKHSSVHTFAIPHSKKTCRRGKEPHPNLKFYNFPGDSKLCVCKAIDSYLERRNIWGFGESQFLVGHIKPHKLVSPSTVSRWLGQVLAMAGINTDVFRAHTTRSASSSKAEVTGVSFTDIIKQGHWSQASTFQRFYRKTIKEYNSNFQSGMLNKQLCREKVRVITSSFSNTGQAAVLDQPAEISRCEI